MPLSLLRCCYNAVPTTTTALPIAALVTTLLSYVATPKRHSLLTTAVAWAALCAYSSLGRAGAAGLLNGNPSQKLAWTAGGLFALVSIGEKAASAMSIWWAKALLPCILYLLSQNNLLGDDSTFSPGSPSDPGNKSTRTTSITGSRSALVLLTGAALVASYTASGSATPIAIGLSSAFLQSLAFFLVDRARSEAIYSHSNGGSIIYSANGLLAQPNKPDAPRRDVQMTVIRDVSAAAMLATGAAAIGLERLTYNAVLYPGVLRPKLEEHSFLAKTVFVILQAVCASLLNSGAILTTLLLIQRHGALMTSFIPLSAATVSQLILQFSFGRLWFAVLCGASMVLFLDEHSSTSGSTTSKSFSRMLTLLAIASFGIASLRYLTNSYQVTTSSSPQLTDPSTGFPIAPSTPHGPMQLADSHVHPVEHLVRDAEARWMQTFRHQSPSLAAAVTEYKRRYKISPPPNFDKWYAFAKRKGVQIIDDYDSIYHSLLPFWALPPSTIRARTREALGFGDNQLMGLLIRDGKAEHVENGPKWLQEAIVGMTTEFIDYLPDMDMAFNLHDEPRVVVPHDELSKLVGIALENGIAEAAKQLNPRNAFSGRAADVDSGKRIAEVKITRFNVFAHQPTWLPSRLSCSPDSPARTLLETEARDNLTTYALSDLGFIYNQTAFSDVCNSPSLASTYGFFDRPNAFNVVHDLFPIFSQSKMSSFQDILYPSPWYWYGKVEYLEEKDMDWETKINHLFWRGSTTGGFSRNGGWRRQHRQHIVQKLNALDKVKILEDTKRTRIDGGVPDESSVPDWQVREVDRDHYDGLMDVHFSHVGQCDPGDCDAQREFFKIVEPVGQQEAWKYKYLLDMDGNAFSGRFYAFLRSKSLPFKMALFREWHDEWLRPWVHFVPLSLRADDALESVRYLSAEPEGKKTAVKLAERGREWSQKALRNADLEVWLFRLMLEYGRLVDDNRATIGFDGV